MICLFSCRGRTSSGLLKVGLSEEPRTLNIWLASDANSKKILSLIYQPLYLLDPTTHKMIPWLASSDPVFDPETTSYLVHLRHARWSDGSEVTSTDVAFTAYLIKKFRIPRYFSKWNFINKIETPDKYSIRFYLKEPKAIFLTRTLTASIVPEKEWSSIVKKAEKMKKPLMALLNHKMEKPLGCGPFTLKEWHRGSYLFLEKNRYFFGENQRIGGHRTGPFINGILIKIFGTSDVAVLALKKGSIDMFWWAIQPGYLQDLQKQDNIKIYFSKKSALYFMGFNLRKKPFSDISLRHAAAFLIDKDFIISRILQGYGARMDSIIPPGNIFWFCPDVSRYGEKMGRKQRIKKAYSILHKSGYTWQVPPVDNNGNIVPASGIKLPDGNLMERFTILTPPADYDPHRAMSGMMIQEWFRDLGIPAYSKPMSFGALLEKVKGRHDFDAFILGYGKMAIDPDYLRIFFYSGNDKKRGWNMSGYANHFYDIIAEKSSSEMDSEVRKKLICRMQQIIMEDIPYFPLYNPLLIEAVRKDRFKGWVQTLGGIGNIWSFSMLKPI